MPGSVGGEGGSAMAPWGPEPVKEDVAGSSY